MSNNNNKRFFIGKVISKKMQKTATVEVERTYAHPIVHKVVVSRKKFHVHDPLEQANVGDTISFYEGKPVSKSKHMYLDKVLPASSEKNISA